MPRAEVDDGGTGRPEVWLATIPELSVVEDAAVRAEEAGFDGMAVTDSQNLTGDPFVAIALAARATSRLRFMTGVTNAVTRDPAVLASTAATVHEVAGGRTVLGIGRGDTALFHLGRKPQPVAPFAERLAQIQDYLAGRGVDRAGHDSRILWLRRAQQTKVPLDVAAAGPRVIALAAGRAERVTLAVAADPARVAWGVEQARRAAVDAGRPTPSLGAYVVVGCHPDRSVARDLVRGALAAFMHFSAMPGSTGAGVAEDDRAAFAELGERYDSRQHLRTGAAHSEIVTDDLVDRHAVVGPPEACIERLSALVDLGIERFVVAGPTLDADPVAARASRRLLRDEVLAGVHALRAPVTAAR